MKGIVILMLLFVFVSCKKAEDRRCTKFSGKTAEKEIELPDFDKVFFGSHIKFVLVQGLENKMVVKGWENLNNHITSDVVDGTLRIENKNKCRFLRSYKKVVTVELHFKELFNIIYEGTEELNSNGVLNFSYLTILMRDGAGTLNINLNAQTLDLICSNGWCNYQLQGNVNYANFKVQSNGFGDASSLLIADSLIVRSSTSEQLYFNADAALLRVEINNYGNVYYRGVPNFIEFNKYGSGELINY